ncbi:hypothetical protein [Sphingobacterium griseoflavum]|nr:hypothetical protein [Sphingobacterium griseoflavum]
MNEKTIDVFVEWTSVQAAIFRRTLSSQNAIVKVKQGQEVLIEV